MHVKTNFWIGDLNVFISFFFFNFDKWLFCCIVYVVVIVKITVILNIFSKTIKFVFMLRMES
ncbi:hypothetical protein HanRHA438_Chr12g0567361 [Helianthus annuus]|nr:hypothetical protein HanRHA438_Chr12g0567361 [Helianthus annuus]